MIFLIRASHANEFELQNYAPIAKKFHIQAITSRNPLTEISVPSTKLWSPTDLPDLLFRRQLLNRLIGGEQWLSGLEKVVKFHSVESVQRNIVHTAETYTPYTHQMVQMRKIGQISKLICTCWETIPHNNEKFARLRKWKKEAYQYVDLFHTPTQLAKQALIAEGVDSHKIVVIPYGVDLNKFKPRNPRSTTSKQTRKTVLTVARLEKEKGMEDLAQVALALPQYDFLVIGKGSYHLRGDNIKTSSVPYSQIHTLYQKADLFFLPSRSTPTWEEQYGMALVEAMASGLPIVTTSSGAIPEVLGEAGVKIQEGDTPSMIEQIDRILEDPQIRLQLCRAARSRAKERYDSQKVSTQLVQLYTS